MSVMLLGDVCEINPSKKLALSNDTEISFIPMEAISIDGHIDVSRSIPVEKIKNYTVFREGDILFAKITPCMENGKGAITVGLKNGWGAGSTEFIVLRPDTGIVLPQWVYLFLSQKSFRLNCQQNMTGSAGQKRVPAKYLAKCKIPVPSITEQEQIISRIEELLSQLDKGVETLQKTKQQLAVYRQAVLMESFHSITAQEMCLEDICGFITKGTTPPKQSMTSGSGVVPYIKVYNLTFDGTLDFSIDPTFVDLDTHKGFLGRSVTFPGDVLMNIVGPPLGKVSIVPNTYPEWNINQAIARFRCSDLLYNKYLAYYLGCLENVEELKSKAKATAGQINLTLEICRNIRIPLPSVEDQKRIVFELEKKLSLQASIEAEVDSALDRAKAIRQSILKQAFEGRLL